MKSKPNEEVINLFGFQIWVILRPSPPAQPRKPRNVEIVSVAAAEL